MLAILLYFAGVRQCLSQSSCLSILQENTDSFHQMLKNSGKGVSEVGKYETCLRQSGQYAMLGSLAAGPTSQFRLGVCLPQECNITDLNTSLHSKNIFLAVPTEFNLSLYGIIYLLLFTVIVGITIASTVLHCVSAKYTKYRLVKCFTAVDSLHTLMRTRANNKLGCINGIRAVSFIWVVYGHCFLLKIIASSLINFERINNVFDHFWGVMGPGGFYAVDIFFCITGLLVSYFLLIELEKTQGKLRWGLMYFHRIVRILPTYAFVMGFCYFLVPLMNSGPMWTSGMEFMRQDCDKYWWSLFLFISNFVPDGYSNNCFGIGWYLSNDMQFFLVGPLLVYFYYKLRNKLAAWGLFVALIMAVTIFSYYFAYSYDFRLSIMDAKNLGDDGDLVWNMLYYVKPYIRITPYFQGIMAGILFSYYEKMQRKEEIKERDTVSLLVVRSITKRKGVSAALMIAGVLVMYYFIVFQQPVYKEFTNSDVWSRNTNAVALACSKSAFILGLLMFTVPVLMNQTGLVNRFLASALFEPIAKLSYAGFLIHYAVMLGYYSSQYNTLGEGIFLFRDIFTFVPIILGASVFIYVCVEIPFQNIEKIMFHKSE